MEAIRFESLEMPPSGKLPDSTIADFVRWIEMGAPDPRDGGSAISAQKVDFDRAKQLWSLQPLEQFPPPIVRDDTWSCRQIDRFVQAGLDEHSLAPSPPAERQTLIRRAYFDLTGLPPTVETVDAFLQDSKPDAYERLIDRLMATPHYGQRWGRHWLDVVRYGDDHSNVVTKTPVFHAYRYRDWVVSAINEDVPYNEFVKRQLATDKLSQTGSNDLPALGFIGAAPQYHKELRLAKPVIQKLIADEWDERLDALTRGLLGLTVACARCHDHKFDPVTQEDYYALAGVFASTRLVERPIIGHADLQIAERANEHLSELERQIHEIELAGAAATQSFTREPHVASLAIDGVFNNYSLALADNSGRGPPWWKLDLIETTDIAKIVVYNRGDDGRTASRLRDITVSILDSKERVLWKSARLNPENSLGGGLFDKGPERLVLDLLQINNAPIAGRWIRIERTPDPDLSGTGGVGENDDRSSLNLGDVEIFEGAQDPRKRQLLEKPLTPAALERVAEIKDQIEHLRTVTPYIDIPMAQAVEDASLFVNAVNADLNEIVYRSGEARDLPIFIRGNPATPGSSVVPRRFLSVFSTLDADREPKLFQRGSGRLELADAIFDEGFPLSTRVIVNRVWMHHFGRGLVNTPSNFGANGAPPTHPRLLTDLAARFVQSGWSLKWLHREIMLSATYQQDSGGHSQKQKIDPANNWFWRMNRRRLEVEAWRDGIMSVAGTLDPAMGGPPLDLDSPDNQRQTIYGSVSRVKINNLLGLLDFPDPAQHSPAREITTTPLQQLFVLNSDFMIHHSAALAQRAETERSIPAIDKIRRLYELALSRRPTAQELELALDFLEQAADRGKPRQDLWNQYAQALLSTNELMFVD